MQHGHRIATLLFPLILLLSSCGDDDSPGDESPGPDPEPFGQPAVVASWGRNTPAVLVDIAGDILLTRNDRRLYMVRRSPSYPNIIVLDRDSGERSLWAPEAGTGRYPTAIDGSPSGDVLCVLFGFERVIGIFSGDHELIDTWAIPELPINGFTPVLQDIAYSAEAHEVAVTDASGSRLHLFRLDGTAVADPVAVHPEFTNYSSLRTAALPTGDFLVTVLGLSGSGIRRFGPDGSNLGAWGEAYFSASAMVVGGDGNVYIPTSTGDAVRRFNPGGVLLGVTAMEDLDPIVRGIGALDATATGDVLIGDSSFPAIHEYSAGNRRERSHFLADPPEDEVGQPGDLVVGPDGTVFSVDLSLRRVAIATATGGIARTWGGPGTTERPLGLPISVAPAPDGSVYVLDSDLRQLRNYSRDGTLNHVRTNFAGYRLASGPDWMYATGGGIIWRRPAEGGVEVEWEQLPDTWRAHGPFYFTALDVDANGTLYGFDPHPDSPVVVTLDANGAYLGQRRLSPTPTSPVDFAVDDSGRIYVVGGVGGYAVYDEDDVLVAWWQDHFACYTAAIDVDPQGFIYLARAHCDYRKLAPIP